MRGRHGEKLEKYHKIVQETILKHQVSFAKV
jgi:hypothetical protein